MRQGRWTCVDHDKERDLNKSIKDRGGGGVDEVMNAFNRFNTFHYASNNHHCSDGSGEFCLEAG